MDEKITSRENAKIKYACRLASSTAFRRTEGRFLAEGRKLCPELCRGAELETLFYTENAMEKCPELAALPGEHYLVEDHVADKLADVGTHQGMFGVFRTPVHTLEEVRPGGRYLALERTWTKPHGGYFISFDSLNGCAKEIVARCKKAGVVMTGAGATYPYGKDPEDRNIRIAPSYPPLQDLIIATELFALCVKLVSVNKLLEEM